MKNDARDASRVRPGTRSAAVKRRPKGLSLLEVMLAIAILGLAVAGMGELIRLGTRAAAETRDLTKAQILCEGKMSELAAGVIPPESINDAPFEQDPDWTYSIMIAPLEQEGLLQAQVSVALEAESGQAPVTFSLSRWLVDPVLEMEPDPAAESATQAPTTSSAMP